MRTMTISKIFFFIFLISLGFVIYITKTYSPNNLPYEFERPFFISVVMALISFVVFPITFARGLSEPEEKEITIFAKWNCTLEEWIKFWEIDKLLKDTYDAKVERNWYLNKDTNMKLSRNADLVFAFVAIVFLLLWGLYYWIAPKYSSWLFKMIIWFEVILFIIYYTFVLRYKNIFSSESPVFSIYHDWYWYRASIWKKHIMLNTLNWWMDSVIIKEQDWLKYMEIIYSFENLKRWMVTNILRLPVSFAYEGIIEKAYLKLKWNEKNKISLSDLENQIKRTI